jgi:predicted P-loop ATPase/GTPase
MNIDIIQRLQSEKLRAMTNAPWYVSNDTLHNDLGIPITSDVIKERSNKHHNRLETNINPLMQPLL